MMELDRVYLVVSLTLEGSMTTDVIFNHEVYIHFDAAMEAANACMNEIGVEFTSRLPDDDYALGEWRSGSHCVRLVQMHVSASG